VEEASPRRRAGLALTVRAAGGVVIRAGADGPEVLLVHRPRYDDWTFPKGKCLPGETDEECALREVEEETGVHAELVDELPSTAYRDSRGRPKRVRYWLMQEVDGAFRPNREVDEAVWLRLERAEELLSHGRDVTVLRAAAGR
jgi:8-oxo-dGTP diphosphatase